MSRSQKSISWDPVITLEPPSRPLIRTRWPNPFSWTMPCSKCCGLSSCTQSQSSGSSRERLTWLQDGHLMTTSQDEATHATMNPQRLQVLEVPISFSFRIMKWYLLEQTGCLLQPI